MEQRDTKVSELCLELGVTKATIYRYVAPDGSLSEALRRGRWVETPVQLAEQIGVPMDEDVGTLADIIAACADRWHWPLFLSLWGKSGTSYARRVSDDLIEQIKQGVAPWQKPWKPGERVAPENFSTGKRYTARAGASSKGLATFGQRSGRRSRLHGAAV